MEIYYWAAPLLLVGSWAASFLGSYLKQKGENLATREDLDDLVKQTAALTETTKRIEAEISEATWGRQKRSEMKIDALVQALSALSQLEDALLDLDSASSIDSSFERSRSASEWSVASSRFDTAVVMARIVCKDVGPAILQAGQQIRETANKTVRGETTAFRQSLQNRMDEQHKVLNAVREELGFE